ncbi:MAG: pentapeptide MXKDX repeat protein [Burkholderiales bacterium]
MNKLTATLLTSCIAIASVSAFAADPVKKERNEKERMEKGITNETPASGAMGNPGMRKDDMKKDPMHKEQMKKERADKGITNETPASGAMGNPGMQKNPKK